MTKVAHVAVLLAAFNGEDFIQEQINSILNQKHIEITLFISVDLSTDNTFQLCNELSNNKNNIYVLPYGEKFGGAAANFFRLIRDVDFSKFDYVALADQDDIWLENKLSWACLQILKNGVDAYSSNVLAFWADGREKLIRKSQAQRPYDYLFEAAGPGCTYVMKVEPLLRFKAMILSNVEPIKLVALHDWLLYAFFRASGYKWFIDDEYKMLYRQHETNQVGTNSGFAAAVKRIKLIRNGWYKEQVLLVSSLVRDQKLYLNSRCFILKNISKLRRRLRDRLFLFFVALIQW